MFLAQMIRYAHGKHYETECSSEDPGFLVERGEELAPLSPGVREKTRDDQRYLSDVWT